MKKSFASTFALAKSEANSEYEIEIESENVIDIGKERIEGVKGEEGEPNRFEDTWQVYPRKVEKAAARKAYDARLRDGWSPDASTKPKPLVIPRSKATWGSP